MGRVLHLGPSCHGPSFMLAELAGAELVLGRVVLHPNLARFSWRIYDPVRSRSLGIDLFTATGSFGRELHDWCTFPTRKDSMLRYMSDFLGVSIHCDRT